MTDQIIASMSLDEKIGQFFFLDIRVPTSSSKSEDDIRKIKQEIAQMHIGGLIVFWGDAKETASLLNELQGLSELPLLVGSDIERGVGQIFRGGLEFPTNMALAATGKPNMAYKQACAVRKEALAMGIHIVYAPVCDINTNPKNPIINTRSYGDDPNEVSLFVKEYIRGIEEDKSLVATAKHFPGHGDLSLDSHADLGSLYLDRKELHKRELIPFKAAIEAGVSQIMTAHIALPKITGNKNLPATLSPAIINDLLGKELKFSGLVVSDAFNMDGLRKFFSEEEAVILALKAGVDILLYPSSLSSLIDAIKRAIIAGDLSATRIDKSVRKILALKERLGLFQKRTTNLAALDSTLNLKEHNYLAYRIAWSSLTLVRSIPNVLPLDPNEKNIQCIVFDEDKDNDLSFLGELKKKVQSLNTVIINSDKEDIATICNSCTTIIALYSKVKAWKNNIGLSSVSVKKLNFILKENKAKSNNRVVIISFTSPYVYNDIDKDNDFTFIAAYSHSYYSQIACANSLFSKTVSFRGKLPISMPI